MKRIAKLCIHLYAFSLWKICIIQYNTFYVIVVCICTQKCPILYIQLSVYAYVRILAIAYTVTQAVLIGPMILQ